MNTGKQVVVQNNDSTTNKASNCQSKSVLVEFTEQSKAVVARVEVKYHNILLEHPSKEVLAEAKELFEEAFTIANGYTFKKNR